MRCKYGYFGLLLQSGLGQRHCRSGEWVAGMLKPHVFLLVVKRVVGNNVGKIICVQIVKSL